MLDLNGDGRICASELAKTTDDLNFAEAKQMIEEVKKKKRFLLSPPPELPSCVCLTNVCVHNYFLTKVDIDGDGTIDYEEFLLLFRAPSIDDDE